MSFKCTVHGSYRKDLELIRHVAELFSLVGVEVLCPRSFDVVGDGDGFVRFGSDVGEPHEIEEGLLNILKSHARDPEFFAYFVNPGGYIGPSASYELSMVRAHEVQVYALEQPQNIPIRLSRLSIQRPAEIAKVLWRDS